MLALFEFYYPTQPGNLTERENLRHVHFVFSLRIFVSAFSARTFFRFFCYYLPARLFRNFTFNWQKKVKERSRKRSDKIQLGKGVTALAQLSVLCTLIEHALQTNDSARYIWILIQKKYWDNIRARGLIPYCQYLSTLKYSQAFVDYFQRFPRSLKAELLVCILFKLHYVHTQKKRAKLPCMKNYVHFDFMFFPHEFLLNRATLTYLNLVLKLHQLMQSSLRSPWKVNDGRKRSRRRQCHCFWNPKIRGKTNKKFCKVFKLTN